MTKTMQKQIGITLSLSLVVLAIGTISYSDSAAAIPQMMKSMISSKFKSADKNTDGGLSLAEAKAGGMPKKVLQSFNLIDTNKDGKISESEMFAAFDNGTIKR